MEEDQEEHVEDNQLVVKGDGGQEKWGIVEGNFKRDGKSWRVLEISSLT